MSADSSLQARLAAAFRFVNGHSDVWRLFYDSRLFTEISAALVEPFRDRGATKVAGIEARGFILGGACAVRLDVGFVAIRKSEGLFPGDKIAFAANPDYRGNSNVLRLQTASLGPADCVLLVDDWCETGSQALAARSLIEQAGADFVGLSVIVDQASADVADRLAEYRWLIRAGDLKSAP